MDFGVGASGDEVRGVTRVVMGHEAEGRMTWGARWAFLMGEADGADGVDSLIAANGLVDLDGRDLRDAGSGTGTTAEERDDVADGVRVVVGVVNTVVYFEPVWVLMVSGS